ncbi:hypothetical protein HJC23_006983 [Cyclotella cryptica]|uniref:Uncharacterized protein n=1 Tax=Cyclotella cryptica TaxID=29204 RepID=A0ABD3QMQ5_9STRA
MCDSITSLPSIIQFNKPPRLHVHEGQRRRRYRKQWRGSHQGYSGDTECLSPTASCSSEDEESVQSTGRKSVTSITTATTAMSCWTGLSSSVRMQFYGNIPKRRTRAAKESSSQECIDNTGEGTDRANSSRVNPAPAPSHIHPEIDLSRVRVISCQEHDLRQWKKDRDFMKRVLLHQDEDQSDPSQSEDSCDTSSVSPSLVKEKRRGGLWSGPLAVFDHGSVFEFGKIDTSCSILNQIYDLDSFRPGSAFDHNTSSMQDVLNMGSSVPRTTSLTYLPALSGIGFKRDSSSLNILEKECKRSKHETSAGIRSALDCSLVEQTSLTLEEAVSFSPFAR